MKALTILSLALLPLAASMTSAQNVSSTTNLPHASTRVAYDAHLAKKGLSRDNSWNPLATLLRSSAAATLSAPVVDSIAILNADFVRHTDSVLASLDKTIAALPYELDIVDLIERIGDAYDVASAAIDARLDILVPAAKSLLTSTELEMFPREVTAKLELR
jgi:hypothetical protein